MSDYDYEVARARLAEDVKVVLADTEELVEAVRTDSKERMTAARPRVEAALKRARTRVAELEASVAARARQVAREADVYAHEHPWQTAGMAAAGGALIGAVLGVLLARR
jgi:ElaB/YqjD/DUF883 family membrane-anchored ribosome-binding protein